MTAPLLTRYGRTAELARGLKWVDEFESNETVLRNGGIIIGSPIINFGATFNGSTDLLEYSRYPEPQEITLSCEVVLNSKSGASNIVSVYDSGTSLFAYILRHRASDSELQFLINDGGVQSAVSDADINENQKYSIMATYDGTTLKLYIDGVLQSATDTATSILYPTSNKTLQVGHYFNGSNSWDGTIKDLKIFNTALTAQEAADYYNRTTWRYREHTKFYLPMRAEQHDPVNVRTLDASGNGKNGTLGDGSTATTYPTKLTRRGYSFDGGDYIAMPNSDPIWSGTAGYTIAMVINDAPGSVDRTIFGEGYSTSTTPIFRLRSQATAGQNLVVQLRSDALVNLLNNVLSDSEPFDGGHHTIIWTDEAGDAHLYVDGMEDATDFSYVSSGLTLDRTTIGAWISNAVAEQMTGEVLFCSSYTRKLTPTQVWDLHLSIIGRLNDV